MESIKQRPSCLFKLKCHNSGYISIKLKEKLSKKIDIQSLIESTLDDPSTGFEIKLVPAQYEEESYEIYRKYSETIHNISESKNSYKAFLCQQALKECPIQETLSSFSNLTSNPLKYGCFHMKYYLNKILIAVGVVDILPKGLSSVYFFYDPEYKKKALGVLGCLREINLVSKLSNDLPRFKYYFMGYYVQSTSKMKYKGDYEPSELLCPNTMVWVKLDSKTRQIIENHFEDPTIFNESSEYVAYNQLKPSLEREIKKEYLLNKKKIFVLGQWMDLSEFNRNYMNHYFELLVQFAKLLGKELLERINFRLF